MVERYVRDVEAAGSNPVTSINKTRLDIMSRRVLLHGSYVVATCIVQYNRGCDHNMIEDLVLK